eukprot:scaffold35037_cov27-Phaeocystis_antarctica.AAC.2
MAPVDPPPPGAQAMIAFRTDLCHFWGRLKTCESPAREGHGGRYSVCGQLCSVVLCENDPIIDTL